MSGTTNSASAFSHWQSQAGAVAQRHLKNLSAVLGCTVVSYEHVKTCTCPTPLEAQFSPDLQGTSANCLAHWLVVNGLTDVQPLRQAVAMDNAPITGGCPHTLVLFSNAGHSFRYWILVTSQIQTAVAAG